MTITFELPVLSVEVERALAQRVEAGVLAASALQEGRHPLGASTRELEALRADGEEAFGQLVSANLRLVTLVTNPIARRSGLDPDDLFQEGVVGLLEAARRFDFTNGARFATFALPWIRLRVGERAVTRFGELGLPAARAKRWVRVRASRDRLRAVLGRTPTVDEVARQSGVPVDQVAELLAFRAPVLLGAEGSLGRSACEEQPEVDALALARLLRSLCREERAILTRLYGLANHPVMSYAEVADALAMSPSTVRRREQAALRRLRGLAERADLVA